MGYYKKLVLRVLFALLLVIFSSVIYYIIGPITLYSSYLLLKPFSDAILSGNIINIDGNSLEFIEACAATLAYILLGILILLTYGISLKKGIKLFLIGSLLIFIANLIRIEVLIYILVNYGIDYFNTLHLFIWKIVSSVYVALVWIFLCYKYKIKGIPVYSDLKKIKERIK
ncbi:MAG: pacearchaeosortase [Nanoarchaeota archaeon]